MIIAFGTYDASRHPRVGILIDGLRSHGHHVVEVNHPLGLTTSERVRMLRQPWRLPALAVRLAACWIRLWRGGRAAARGQDVDAVLVGYLGHFDVLLARRVFPGATIVLDHLVFASDTAVDRGAGGSRVQLLARLDSAALAACDIPLVDTEEHRQMLPEPRRGMVVPVGARAEWFRAGEEAAGRPDPLAPDPLAEPGQEDSPLRVVFFGLFTPLQGATTIAEAVRLALDDGACLSVTLIGSGQDWGRAKEILGTPAGVEWIEWIEPEKLADVVASHDVCLGIFGKAGKARRVVPNKVYEGLAAGCAVITGDTPPQRRVLADAVELVPPGDAPALARALAELAADGSRVTRLRRAARTAAQRFSAEAVAAELATRLSTDLG